MFGVAALIFIILGLLFCYVFGGDGPTIQVFVGIVCFGIAIACGLIYLIQIIFPGT